MADKTLNMIYLSDDGKYIKDGTIDKILFPVILPEPAATNSYEFGPVYNMSKDNNNNRIVVFMKQIGTPNVDLSPSSSPTSTFEIKFDPTKALKHDTTVLTFDMDKPTLVFIFHEDFNASDLEKLYTQLPLTYDTTTYPSRYIYITNKTSLKGKDIPRKAGMSIIPKGIKP